MEGINNILNKLTMEDVKKLQVLLSIDATTAPTEVITLRVFCDEYKELIMKNRSKNYYDSVVISLKHLTNYFGLQKSIRAIAYKDVEMFVTDLKQKVSKGYRVYYRTLKAAFNKAVEWNYIDENYFTKVKLPKKNKLNPAFISETELKQIVEQDNPDVVKDVIVFAFYTGMRLGEIVNLKWKSIDWDRGMIVVGDEEFVTKGRAQRCVPVCGEVERILKSRRQKPVFRSQNEDASTPLTSTKLSTGNMTKSNTIDIHSYSVAKENLVFGKDNGMAHFDAAQCKFTGDYFSKRFKRACKSAGISDSIHFHSLRHSFASSLAQKGVSLYVIKELLGHSSISTTEVYSHLNVDSLREAVEKLDASTPLSTGVNPAEAGRSEKAKVEEIPHSNRADRQVRNDNKSSLRLVVNNSLIEV